MIENSETVSHYTSRIALSAIRLYFEPLVWVGKLLSAGRKAAKQEKAVSMGERVALVQDVLMLASVSTPEKIKEAFFKQNSGRIIATWTHQKVVEALGVVYSTEAQNIAQNVLSGFYEQANQIITSRLEITSSLDDNYVNEAYDIVFEWLSKSVKTEIDNYKKASVTEVVEMPVFSSLASPADEIQPEKAFKRLKSIFDDAMKTVTKRLSRTEQKIVRQLVSGQQMKVESEIDYQAIEKLRDVFREELDRNVRVASEEPEMRHFLNRVKRIAVG